MFDLHSLIGRNLINADNGQSLGEIKKIAWDKPYGISVVTTEQGRYRLAKLTETGTELVAVCENNDEPRNLTSLKAGEEIYDTDGRHLGELANVQFNSAMKLTKLLAVDGTTYTRGKISAAGDIIIVKTGAASARKKPKTNNALKATYSEQEPSMNDSLDNQPPTDKPITEEATQHYGQYPVKRRYGDFSFLLGKTADKNIINFYGEIMLKRGEKITLDVLRQAKLSGKLIELCLHAN